VFDPGNLFQDGAYSSGALYCSEALVTLLALLATVRLSGKNEQGTNALAYSASRSVAKKKVL
jgi:hypothetical protein